MARGSLHKRKDSKNWYMQYPDGRGRWRQRTTGTHDRVKAERLLREQFRDLDDGKVSDYELVDLPFSALRKAIITDYRNNRRKSLTSVERRFQLHLDPYFDKLKVTRIATRHVREYQARRLDEGAAHATVNREIAALRRGFTLLRDDHPSLIIPRCPKLEEHNTRQGFITLADHDALQGHLPEELKGIVQWAFWTGWRKGEILGLRWEWVDEQAGIVRIPDSKNGEPRKISYNSLPALVEVIEEQRWYTRIVAKRTGHLSPWVFNRDGDPLKDFRWSWQKAVKAAGFPHLLFHDLRRSAVVNLERAGVPRSVAMSITGHKTESVYRRYAIADFGAQDDAFAKLAGLKAGGRTVIPMTGAQ